MATFPPKRRTVVAFKNADKVILPFVPELSQSRSAVKSIVSIPVMGFVIVMESFVRAIRVLNNKFRWLNVQGMPQIHENLESIAGLKFQGDTFGNSS